jgi:glucan phosphoethanolaminetransferase (alkaline phosphatase superfamily)
MDLLCFLNATLHAPGWRPHFQFYGRAQAFVGALLCVATLLLLKASMVPWLLAISTGMALLIAACAESTVECAWYLGEDYLGRRALSS